MLSTVLSIVAVVVFVAALAALYVWTRRTESESIYEPRPKSEDEANAQRLGIALNATGGTFSGN
ncbi:MAG TPA: hypothetical protein VMB79_16740 [Jatrophihabitans sp.]|nr:hypothetical protein [Jatrophihabitans sp.]